MLLAYKSHKKIGVNRRGVTNKSTVTLAYYSYHMTQKFQIPYLPIYPKQLKTEIKQIDQGMDLFGGIYSSYHSIMYFTTYIISKICLE